MKEDRIAILKKALVLAKSGVKKFYHDKNQYKEYCRVGLEYVKFTGDWSYFDAAVECAKDAQEKILDPELTAIVSSFESKAQRIQKGDAA